MQPDKRGREDWLLDFHLDQLEGEQRSWIEAELLRDAAFRAQSDRLGAILRPLDHWTVTPTPPSLPDRVLRALDAGERSRAIREDSVAVPRGARAFSRRLPGFRSLREVIAVAACIGLLATVAFPGLSAVRARAQRTRCVANLGSIFRGTTLYQQSFGGSLPYAGHVPGASWLPTGTADAPYASNSRHIYLVAKLNYGPKPEDFTCPSTRACKPMRRDELCRYQDFASASNITYASLNLAGPTPNLRPPKPIAYVSDMNPLFVNGRFDESVDPDTANSPAHRGRGQSVLILDGSVVHLNSPIYGNHRDNLWLAGSIRRYRGTETPIANDDAFLIPGYPSSGATSNARY